jgi:hypothetical protein
MKDLPSSKAAVDSDQPLSDSDSEVSNDSDKKQSLSKSSSSNRALSMSPPSSPPRHGKASSVLYIGKPKGYCY